MEGKMKHLKYTRSITPADIKSIMLDLAATIETPHGFTNEALSINSEGTSESVFSEESISRDLFGWVLQLSFKHWSDMRSGRKGIGDVVAMFIDSHIRTVSGDKLRLLTLGDTGPHYAAQYLRKAATALPTHHLPWLFEYNLSEEEKQERFLQAFAESLSKKIRRSRGATVWQ